MKRIFAFSIVTTFLLAIAPGLAAAAQAVDATNILEATGVEGGLIVHLGCGDGRTTASLPAHDGVLVHGLDTDPANVREARRYLRAQGIYGAVSAEVLGGAKLPYADNLVNLLVAEVPGDVSMVEIMRVLVPEGVAYVRQGEQWKKHVKPRPDTLDEWTHFLHDATGNAVAKDEVVGPPRRLQWVGAPKWARSHEHLASISAVVSSGGRMFYIADEGPTASVTLPAEWFLVARDAFNGIILWKKPMPVWESHHRPFRSGPAQLPRRLVAVGDRIYVTLGYGAPVTALNAATGDKVRSYVGTDGATEIVHAGDVLFVVVGGGATERPIGAALRRGQEAPSAHSTVMAFDADTGKPIWQKRDEDTERMLPLTFGVGGGRALLQNTRQIVCLDAQTGEVQWRADRPAATSRPAWAGPSLVVYDDIVLSADRAAPGTKAAAERSEEGSKDVSWSISFAGGGKGGELIALSAKTGKKLWSAPCVETYNAPPDILVSDGLVWTGSLIKARDPGITVARDVRTGEVRKERPVDQKFFQAGMPHHRCYRNKATEKYLLLGRAGVEFIDTDSGDAMAHHWVRGTCQYGIMPANGLLYAPPHSCACFIKAKLNGFNALSGAEVPKMDPAEERLVQGPAYGDLQGTESSGGTAQDWTTYRHDAARSGHSQTSVPAELDRAWQVKLGGRLSSPVVADGKVFVAQIDQHTVHALQADRGEELWHFTVGGRVDSPPALARGLVVFGSADGWVYCLRAADGQLLWRFRAGPEARRIVSYGQLESAWPVHGSVLVQERSPDTADREGAKQFEVMFAAGRSSFLDGGIRLVRLDLETGELLSETVVDDRDPKTGHQPTGIVKGFGMNGALPDVLSADDESVYMRHVRFDRQGTRQNTSHAHLFSPTGFLDDSWWHRSYWLYGSEFDAGWGGWWRAGNRAPSGRLLVFNDEKIYGFGRSFIPGGNAGQWNKGEFYQLFAAPRNAKPSPAAPGNGKKASAGKRRGKKPADKPTLTYDWSQKSDVTVRAMVLADKTLFVAGTLGPAHKSLDAFLGNEGAVLRGLSAATGDQLAEYPLGAPPVFDGLIAANGRLYLAARDGTVTCMIGN